MKITTLNKTPGFKPLTPFNQLVNQLNYVLIIEYGVSPTDKGHKALQLVKKYISIFKRKDFDFSKTAKIYVNRIEKWALKEGLL